MSLPVKGGRLIGFPYQGSHKPGATTPANWQSDNAVDIAVPSGTPVYAVHDGTVGPNIGYFRSSSPYLQGQRLSVLWTGDAAYYAHLSRIVVHPGQQVKAGQLLGYSGVANGVAHLHFATEAETPLNWVKGIPQKVSNLVSGEDAQSAVGTPGGSVTGAGCAGTAVLFAISILGGFEIVKILL